jgi:N-acetylglucosamine malate deacetylase 1
MSMFDPNDRLRGAVVIVSPHMDDGELGCGGTVLQLVDKNRIHFVYVADGTRSPYPVMPRRQAVTDDIGAIRMEESRAALRTLGVPMENVHFLAIPEAGLPGQADLIREALGKIFQRTGAAHVFAPFRYDRHPDHLVVHHAVKEAIGGLSCRPNMHEYFIYFQSRLLPRRDIRRYILPRYLYCVDISKHRDRKRQALACHVSQVSRFYAWQLEPVLSSEILDVFSRGPEIFLRTDKAPPGAAVFMWGRHFVRLANHLEPVLKREKDRLRLFLYSLVVKWR